MKDNDWMIGAIAAAIVGYLVWPKNTSESGVPNSPTVGNVLNQSGINSNSNSMDVFDKMNSMAETIQKSYIATPEQIAQAKADLKAQTLSTVKELLVGGELTEPILAAIKPRLAEWAKNGELMK